ncbi:putative hydrolase (putative) [Fructilactobacillus fructivorans]|nr:HD domain-containing protein [Fructilactobacillus fructivorans]KRN12470.1 putative hydrolase (putative) [Fructilactobacillus fructivorans]
MSGGLLLRYYSQPLKYDKVFRDPVLGHIYVENQVILDLINTPEFQRLRRIKQLGTTSLTFHGAEHTRFSHSLGVYEITRRICDNFQRNYPTKEAGDGLWDDSERIVALCAALLHDVGHGAYSHTFEHIFHTNHEQITQQIITSKETEINHVLSQVGPDFPERVASVINKTYDNPQVVQMISSQVDADRMDYLLSDSYYTGAQYGKFDLDRILQVMRPYSGGICFRASGLHAIEYYIVCRFQMHQQVYFHPVSRSMEVILSHLLMRAKELALKPNSNFKPSLLMPIFENHYSLDDYLQIDDGVLNTYFIMWRRSEDPILSDLAKRFLNRHPFKSAKYDDQTEFLIPKLQEIIEKAGFNPKYYTATDNSFDQPYDVYDPKSKHQNAQIELMENDGNLVELSQASDLVKAITGKLIGDKRFFFPREMLKPTKNVELFQSLYDEFQKYIDNDNLIIPKEN